MAQDPEQFDPLAEIADLAYHAGLDAARAQTEAQGQSDMWADRVVAAGEDVTRAADGIFGEPANATHEREREPDLGYDDESYDDDDGGEW